MAMTQQTMNQLYERDLYSTINYYLGLLTLLKAGAEVSYAMEQVPDGLLGKILEIAGRHRESNPEITDHQEAAIIDGIVQWGRSHTTTHGQYVEQAVTKPKRRRSKSGQVTKTDSGRD